MTSNGKTILIVDDDNMNIVILAHYLKPPYEIMVAQNGTTALKMAEQNKPDIILLDIIMPDMNGFDVFAKLKEYPPTMNIPVIFLTELDTKELIRRGLSLGALDYITKPFDKTVIKEKIDSYFGTND